MRLTGKTTFSFGKQTIAINNSIRILRRDFQKVFGTPLKEVENADVKFIQDSTLLPEQFSVNVSRTALIRYSDELAAIYAILYISREWLGVDDFWYWTEKEPKSQGSVEVPEVEYLQAPARVRYRGWFVNDEVCLIGWSDEYPPSVKTWKIVFETLLRLGGNMVIPGTDLPRNGEHFKTASEMGLYITHHHAEPLGAEMFLRAYPDKKASYDMYPKLFQQLWKDAIEKNKDKKLVWTLGFRGQGDMPFWESDPKYKTPESRGALIRSVIDKQYQMICEAVEKPVCAVYLYGEITELYESGYLEMPDEFIKIWSDNGYGKMVTRRRGNYDPRVVSLPANPGSHGLYYHITFHDLQASSHLTLLGNPPEMVNDELTKAFKAGADKYLLLNCGNIRPHIYMLDLVAKLWNAGEADICSFKNDFKDRFLKGSQLAIECYNKYFEAVIKYGKYDDDRAGEEIYPHTIRRLCTDWMRGEKTDNRLIWAAGDLPLDMQIEWFGRKCSEAILGFKELLAECEEASWEMGNNIFFRDNLILQVQMHLGGAEAVEFFWRARVEFLEGKYPQCFILLSDAAAKLKQITNLMKASEHGKWEGFYSCDWLSNFDAAWYAVDSLRKYVRMISDGPHLFSWYKNYVMPETERQIYLENTQRRTLSDDELADKLRNVFEF